jgi:carbamoyl-phosphate synthase large subunit
MSKKEVNVLITAASRRVSLVRNFRKALHGTPGKVITVDNNTFSPALYFGHNHYTVPLVNDPNYLDALEAIVKKEHIKLIVPTIDDELAMWARVKPHFESRGVYVSVSPLDTVKTCVDKWETFRFCRQHQIPFPETYMKSTLHYDMTYPLFIKPRFGRGSVNAFQVKSKRELDFFIDYVPEPVVQDFLPGREFTVDMLFSRAGELVSYVPRFRLVIRSGVTDRGKTFRNDHLSEWVEKIGKLMPFCGAINIQGKILKNDAIFFEINPRYAGGIQLTTAAGPNFADFLVREARGEKIKPHLGEYENNLVMTSYEDSLFINTDKSIGFFYLDNKDILPESMHCKL